MPDRVDIESPPATWANWIKVVEVPDGAVFCSELFRKTFGQTVPNWGRHIVAFYTDPSGSAHALSYLHFWQRERAGYIGGGCTDGEVVRSMSREQQTLFTEAGGALFHTLRFAFTHFDTEIDAFFGLAENPRAREVDLAAGFEDSGIGNLLIRATKPLDSVLRAKLIDQALEIGNF